MNFIIDFETLDNKPTTVVINASILVFDFDEKLTFSELVAKGKVFKFSIADQRDKGRTINKSTIEWWKDQTPEAKKQLVPLSSDLTLEQGVKNMLEFLKENGINKKSIGWCRGMSFDFPIFSDMIRMVFETDNSADLEPIGFWNQRDIRSAIEGMTLVKGMTRIELGSKLNGFVAHNSLHDCAADVLQLQTAWNLATGNELVENY